jgi:hypothetical protein
MAKRIVWLLVFAGLPADTLAQHASVVSEAEAHALEGIISASGSVRHFCLPCGDSTWRSERVNAVRIGPARPAADEWAVFLNGKPLDAAYLYVQRNGRWENAAWSAGMRFPDIPATLKGAVKLADIQSPDSAYAFFTWSGTYAMEDSMRRAKSRHAATLSYSLRIFDFGDSLTAELQANGMGVAHRMGLQVKGGGDSVTMVLRRYLKGNFGKPFTPGVKLFTMVRGPGGEIRSHWHALKPKTRAAAETGFRRTDLDPRVLDE